MTPLLLGVDIGATNVKAGLFTLDGRLAALASRRNGPAHQPGADPDWLIWDADAIWGSVCSCIRECIESTSGAQRIKAVTYTGFGADGAPVDASHRLLYPFISWHCGRTRAIAQDTTRDLGDEPVFAITGYHNYPINTLHRLRWLRQNRPESLDRAHRWVQIQDYIGLRLSGEFASDCTIASTTMLLDLARRDWCDTLLAYAGVDRSLFPPLRESGTPIGGVTPRAAEETGLIPGTMVLAGGHDCELAALGACVTDPDTFVDINGTWEILVASVDSFKPASEHFRNGLDFECHAVPDTWICQSLMIAGGVLEWVRENFYRDVRGPECYERMMHEAAECGASTVSMLPSFVPGMGPDASHHALGTLLGLTTATRRGQVVRAALEALCFQLRRQCQAVGDAVGRSPARLRAVGGGGKSTLWLQMKADTTGLPIEVVDVPEATLLGAAMIAGVGAGVYSSANEAAAQFDFPIHVFEPSPERRQAYLIRYGALYAPLADQLANHYGTLQGLGSLPIAPDP